ncbi:hypothetical protein [Basfia succiniciproducens]|uniref:hypothetical protein n=1 Tax=Basfia succiniciproducens TaxID=653940 RepID=UPI003FCD604A
MKTTNKYILIPDSDGNFTRCLRAHKFRDANRLYFFEPNFELKDGIITRNDQLFKGEDIISLDGCGFKPASLRTFREYCRYKYRKYKDEEVFINPIALSLGMEEPPYDDKAVTSTKYHL